MIKSFTPKPSDIKREWYVVDAKGKTLGRVATEVARVLRGKHKAIYAPHMDTGDYVVVINAAEIAVTGKKPTDKIYYWHTMWPDGFRQEAYQDRIKRHPTRPVYDAVRGMLPHNRLGRAMLKKLRVYPGADHPHTGQQPKELTLEYVK
jgi:large subunit ribosomal protein L13